MSANRQLMLMQRMVYHHNRWCNRPLACSFQAKVHCRRAPSALSRIAVQRRTYLKDRWLSSKHLEIANQDLFRTAWSTVIIFGCRAIRQGFSGVKASPGSQRVGASNVKFQTLHMPSDSMGSDQLQRAASCSSCKPTTIVLRLCSCL